MSDKPFCGCVAVCNPCEQTVMTDWCLYPQTAAQLAEARQLLIAFVNAAHRWNVPADEVEKAEAFLQQTREGKS